MKIAVYTITKDEEEFIARWADSAKDADYIIVADTGSTDSTVDIAESHGCEVTSIAVKPWRFDDARNAALALVPQDVTYCIALDADEVLVPGWREELEKLDSIITRPRYKYVWSWNQDGSEGLVYGGDKIHSRRNYRWKHPVHEVLVCTNEEVQGWCDLEIHHYPDSTKPRSQYFSLLELAAKESPECDRTAHYLGREYMYYGRHEEGAHELKRHLQLPSAQWRPERAASMRYLAKCEPHNAEHWLLRACAESPERRESWVALADVYYENSLWEQCYATCVRAFSISDKPLDYLCEPHAWGSHVYDIASIAAWHIGLKEKAVEIAAFALELDPENERIAANLEFYQNN